MEAVQELDDIDAMSETIMDMIPSKSVESSYVNQQDTEIEDVVTNTSPDDETTTNGGKRRRYIKSRVRRNMQDNQKESKRNTTKTSYKKRL